MKVEDSKPFVVQCFCDKTNTSQKGEESSCRNYTILVALSATTIKNFIVTAKIALDFRNINAETVDISLPPTE